MKVLVLGASGFMGRHFKEILPKKYTTFLQYKDTWDLFDSDQVKNLLLEIEPDIVINCIGYGGNNKVTECDTEDLTKNLSITYNFYKHSDLFKLYINLGSGVENNFGYDSAYSMSKKLIKEMIRYKRNFINLCVYGCFGKYEKERRLFKRILECQKTGETLYLEDKYFDYISIQDLSRIIDFVITMSFTDNPFEVGTSIDCVYPGNKKKLIDIASMFCEVNNINIKIEVEEPTRDLIQTRKKSYVGDSKYLQHFIDLDQLVLFGLAHGMKEYMND